MMFALLAGLLFAVTLSPALAAGTYDPPKKAKQKMQSSMRDAKLALSNTDYNAALTALAIGTTDEPKNADA